jgi:hypothetical protein
MRLEQGLGHLHAHPALAAAGALRQVLHQRRRCGTVGIEVVRHHQLRAGLLRRGGDRPLKRRELLGPARVRRLHAVEDHRRARARRACPLHAGDVGLQRLGALGHVEPAPRDRPNRPAPLGEQAHDRAAGPAARSKHHIGLVGHPDIEAAGRAEDQRQHVQDAERGSQTQASRQRHRASAEAPTRTSGGDFRPTGSPNPLGAVAPCRDVLRLLVVAQRIADHFVDGRPRRWWRLMTFAYMRSVMPLIDVSDLVHHVGRLGVVGKPQRDERPPQSVRGNVRKQL